MRLLEPVDCGHDLLLAVHDAVGGILSVDADVGVVLAGAQQLIDVIRDHVGLAALEDHQRNDNDLTGVEADRHVRDERVEHHEHAKDQRDKAHNKPVGIAELTQSEQRDHGTDQQVLDIDPKVAHRRGDVRHVERALATTQRNHAQDGVGHLRDHVVVGELDASLEIERDVRGDELDGVDLDALGSIKGVAAVLCHRLGCLLRRDRGRSAYAAELGVVVDLCSALLAIHGGVLSAVPLVDG